MKAPPSWTLDVRGLALKVWEPGAGQGRPVVLLHGFLDQGLCWARTAAWLPGRRLLAPDQRGFGRSGRVGAGGNYHFPDLMADLDALVHHLGEGPIDLVGHSMGGTVAGWYAGARPERVRRLAIVEGMGPPAELEDSPLDRLRLFLDGTRRPPPVPVLPDLEHATARLRRRHPLLDPEHAALLAEHGTEQAGAVCRWSFDRLHMVRSPTPFREAGFAEALAAITASTLIVWAEQSWYAPEVRARRSAALPGARQVTLPGGHMLPYDAPEALGRLLAEHLGDGGTS